MKKVIISLAIAFVGFMQAMPVSAQNKKVDVVYDVVDEMPQYAGGIGELIKFVSTHIQYPKDAEKKKIEGRTLVGFIVEKDGSVNEVKLVRGAYPSLDREALRVVKLLPKWTPGKKDGKAVRVKYLIPVEFRLQ